MKYRKIVLTRSYCEFLSIDMCWPRIAYSHNVQIYAWKTNCVPKAKEIPTETGWRQKDQGRPKNRRKEFRSHCHSFALPTFCQPLAAFRSFVCKLLFNQPVNWATRRIMVAVFVAPVNLRWDPGMWTKRVTDQFYRFYSGCIVLFKCLILNKILNMPYVNISYMDTELLCNRGWFCTFPRLLDLFFF